MRAHRQIRPYRAPIRLLIPTAMLAILMLSLTGCDPSGDRNLASAPSTPTPRVEAQAVDNLLDLYAQAVRQEDIDRLQSLLQPEPLAASTTRQATVPQQAADGTFADLAAFRQALADTFRSHAVTDHTILPATIQIATDYTQVTFVEVESVSDPLFRFHHSRAYDTTLTLQRTVTEETVQFRIRGVRREGPIVEIATQGQLQAGVRSRVEVAASQARFDLDRVEIVDPATGEIKPLRATANGFERAFTASDRVAALPVRLHGRSGELLEVAHPYQARDAGDRVVAAVPGTGGTRLLAITTDADGTVWAGGDRGARLYRVGSSTTRAELVRPLIADPAGRIEDLVVDTLGRLHAVVFSPQRSGVIVRDQETFCQTVNVLDETYPLRDAADQPSVSTRAASASNGEIWLLGSDAGVVQVSDGFRNGQCPATGVEVQYTSVLRRENHELLVNTVPALEVADDGALWIGSALGLARLNDGQLTQVPFDAALSFQGDAATLETFFQDVAQAIFEARPVESVAVGSVSFVEAFGSALVKEDIVFSLAEDHQGRLWIGTLGGGLRRVEVRGDDTVEQTLHVTREDGLASNIIFALAVAPDGAIWAASDDGVSRIESHGNEVTVTTYTALDGLELPARDVAIDAQGTAWVATDGGLFRIQVPHGQIAGQIQDATAQPVADAEVIVHGTSVRTVSDAEGQYTAVAIAPGTYLLEVNGRTSTTGALGTVFRQITVVAGSQSLSPIVLMPPASRQPIDVAQGGIVTFSEASGASLEVPPDSAQLPDGEAAEIGLSLLPVDALPRALPSGFRGAVAARLVPSGLAFSHPARLTLPNMGQLEAGQLLVLLCLDDATGDYRPLGLGRVSADGAVIEPLSGGVLACTTMAFAATATDAIRFFLRPISGNNQRAQPGAELPEPLVVRLEDQYGNPVSGEAVAATIVRGDGTLANAELTTNAQGEARFRVQLGAESEDDLAVQVGVSDLPGVRPVQFFTVVGSLDTLEEPVDIATADGTAYVANGRISLPVIDVSDATRPVLLHTLALNPFPFPAQRTETVAIQGQYVYAGVSIPPGFRIIDISNPRDPNFTIDDDGDELAEVVVGFINFPSLNNAHATRQVAAQGDLAYAMTRTFDDAPGTLYVMDVQVPADLQLLSSTLLPTGDTRGLAVSGDTIYVAASEFGLLVYDARDPSAPGLIHTLEDPNPDDNIEVRYDSRVVVSNGLAYLVETHRDLITEALTDWFTILDLSTPQSPQLRSRITLPRPPQPGVRPPGIAVDDAFAYVVRGNLGLAAVDIRDPDNPRHVGTVNTPSVTEAVAIADSFLYVTDAVSTLQIIQGPSDATTDTDGDGVIDFFDAFPTDATETTDNDGDRLGDHTDPDDDNDGFTDLEERSAIPPTSPTDARDFPVLLPPPGLTTILVDASTPPDTPERQGTEETPYRSITEAFRALHADLSPDVDTVLIKAGLYSPSATQEIIPLEMEGLSNLTVQGDALGTVIIDGDFQGHVIDASLNENLVLENLVVTHGLHGFVVDSGKNVTLRNNQTLANNLRGVQVRGASTGIMITDNLSEGNEVHGIAVSRSEVIIARNVARLNTQHGVLVSSGSTVEMFDNLMEHNSRGGFLAFVDCKVDFKRNIARFNTSSGIFLVSSEGEVRENLSEGNGEWGIALSRIRSGRLLVEQNTTISNGKSGLLSFHSVAAEFRDNTVIGNGINSDNFQSRAGIWIDEGSVIPINGGIVRDNAGHGIYVSILDIFFEPATALIGLDNASILEIRDNGGVGIFVEDDGSEATIDSRNIIFSNNAEGDVVGNVTDVAP